MTEATPQPERRWTLVVSVLVLFLLLFEVSFSFGRQVNDPTDPVPLLDWCYLSFAVMWVFLTYKKKATARQRNLTFAAAAPVALILFYASFKAGLNESYPEATKALVEQVQLHARDVKKIKAELSTTRPTFDAPEDLLTIEPMVAQIDEHERVIEETLKSNRVAFSKAPAAISHVIELLEKTLPSERRQIRNVREQIAVVRAAQSLDPRQRQLTYEQKLFPLMQEEERIEAERLNSDETKELLKLQDGATK